MAESVYKIFDELKDRALGISDKTKDKIQGYLVSFLPTGLPINKDDYSNPWTPDLSGGNSSTSTSDTPETDAAAIAKLTKRQTNLSNLCALVDKKLQVNESGLSVPGSTKISETWKIIIDGAEAVPLEPVNDPVKAKALEKANKLLFKQDEESDNPEDIVMTRGYERYKEYEKKYNNAVRNYTTQYIAAMSNTISANTWPVVGATYITEVDTAYDEWISMGKKVEIENALDLLAAQGTDAAVKMLAMAKKKYQKYSVALGMLTDTVLYTQLFPSNWCDPNPDIDDGWTEYAFDSTKIHSASSSNTTSFGGGTGVNLGFWSVGASAEHSKTQTHSEYSSEGLKIKFKYAIVDINRPWLNTVLFNLDNWYLLGRGKNAISNGSKNQPEAPDNETCWLPAIPTQLVVLKNLQITTSSIKKDWDSMKEHTSAGGSFGYGPFSIKGHYSNDSSKSSFDADLEGEWLTVKGVQLIGYISQIIPASPKQDAPNKKPVTV